MIIPKEILQRAVDVFGNEELAITWFNRDNKYLLNSPIEMLHTKENIEKIMEVLGRLEYGIIG